MDGTRAFDTELDAALVATALRCVGPLLAVAACLVTAALAAEMLDRAGRGRRTATLLRSITPRVFKRLAALAFVAVPLAGPLGDGETPVRDWLANATTTTTAPPRAPTVGPVGSDDAGPASEPAPSEPPPEMLRPEATEEPAPAATVERYVVQPGDCLWTIAEQRLGAGATNLAIDSAWRRVYAMNATAIGADPDLIVVGLVLELPPLDSP